MEIEVGLRPPAMTVTWCKPEVGTVMIFLRVLVVSRSTLPAAGIHACIYFAEYSSPAPPPVCGGLGRFSA